MRDFFFTTIKWGGSALYEGMRRLYIIICVAVVAMFLTGCGAEQAVKKGDRFYALGEYYDASTKYKKAYS